MDWRVWNERYNKKYNFEGRLNPIKKRVRIPVKHAKQLDCALVEQTEERMQNFKRVCHMT